MKRKMFDIFLLFAILVDVSLESLDKDIAFEMSNKNDTERTLSRRKRYLVFPEGSSLQLVFCLTMPSIGMGSIFTIGSTAALAWELPHDPLAPYRRPSEVLHRIDEKPNTYTLSGSKTNDWIDQRQQNKIHKNTIDETYNDPFLIKNFQTPAALYYSTINSLNRKPVVYSTINRNSNKRTQYKDKNTKNSNYYRTITTTYKQPHYMHKRSRRDLYGKLEKLFTAMSRDGKACLLKAVCQVSQASSKKGSFIEEIVKAIFRVKPHDEYQNEDQYDVAANKSHNCTEEYPSCENSIWTSLF